MTLYRDPLKSMRSGREWTSDWAQVDISPTESDIDTSLREFTLDGPELIVNKLMGGPNDAKHLLGGH